MEQFIDKRNFISSSDSFALDILNYKRDGYYVEMGSADPIKGNTTYRMEKDYGWKGLGFDLNEQHAKNYNSVRSNPCLVEDATKFNYLKYFEENNFPKQIDYLQVDIDAGYDPSCRPFGNAYTTLHGLISLPLTQYRFTVITFEHDANMYFRNAAMRDAQREILDSLGYSLVVREIHEDWWVDPTVIPINEFRDFLRWETL